MVRMKVLGLVGALAMVGCAKAPRDPEVVLPPPPREAAPLHVSPAPKRPEVAAGAEVDSAKAGGNLGDHAPLTGPVLEKARGHVSVIYVWASWCMPCQQSLPQLQRLYVKYRGKGVVVIGLSVDDDRKEAVDFATSLSLGFPLEWDEKHEHATKWQVKTMPSAYVVDATGIVRFVQRGYDEGGVGLLEAEVAKLL